MESPTARSTRLFMDRELCIDTCGFFSCLVQRDDRPRAAAAILRDARGHRHLVPTDHGLDELFTLRRARCLGHLVDRVFDITLSSRVCRVEWMDRARFEVVRDYLRQHADHACSITDCFSFCIMAQRGLGEVLTKDEHFRASRLSATARVSRRWRGRRQAWLRLSSRQANIETDAACCTTLIGQMRIDHATGCVHPATTRLLSGSASLLLKRCTNGNILRFRAIEPETGKRAGTRLFTLKD